MSPRSTVVRTLVRYGAWALALGVVVYGVTLVLQLEPSLPPVLLGAGLAVAGLGLLGRSIGPTNPEWVPPTASDPLTRGRDSATFADLRLLENHRAARHPDEHLRRRLAELAERAGSRDRLPADVVRLLDPDLPVRRLSPRDIDRCLRLIEEPR